MPGPELRTLRSEAPHLALGRLGDAEVAFVVERQCIRNGPASASTSEPEQTEAISAPWACMRRNQAISKP